MHDSLKLGAAHITRIEDNLGPALEARVMFPAFRDEIWEAERHWLAPTYFTADGVRLRTSIHSWLVRTGRHTVLIDSCIGNGKDRPHSPHFHRRDVPWLERLRAAGAAPEQIDFVMCTHLHADHVGWNTRLHNGRWAPTFPNARYLFGRTEFERWDTRRAAHRASPFNQNVFDDSILPVAEAGQMVLVEDGHTVDDTFIVESAPGHTAGHARIRLRAGGPEAMFCGDVMHHPVQVLYPDLCSSFDDDQATALASRMKLLTDCADRDIVVLPTHFAEPHGCRIVSGERGYAIRWI
jgi:glyoxylase-like metal-dependent hydrolase (beta-lactamase superfamily II)